MCANRCDCEYNNDYEDDCCPDCASNNIVKGRFGLAFVAETPCCCPEPIGWQVEFCDTPSRVEQRCRDMMQWANCPPLPRCDPCPPHELRSPCFPPKCNPCCPKTNPCVPRCPPRCRPVCQHRPSPSRPPFPRQTSCRCILPAKPQKKCCCQVRQFQNIYDSESTDTFYDDDDYDDDDDDDYYCPCSRRNINRQRNEMPPSNYIRPQRSNHSLQSYSISVETIDLDVDGPDNTYNNEIPVQDTKAAVARPPPSETPDVFRSPMNHKDRQNSATRAPTKPGSRK